MKIGIIGQGYVGLTISAFARVSGKRTEIAWRDDKESDRLEAEDKGYPLLAIQHWLTRDPTTIASMWKGNTVGPKQESLIRRFNPNAYIVKGYADITKNV